MIDYLTVDFMTVDTFLSKPVHCNRSYKYFLPSKKFVALYCGQMRNHQNNTQLEVDGRYDLCRKISYYVLVNI